LPLFLLRNLLLVTSISRLKLQQSTKIVHFRDIKAPNFKAHKKANRELAKNQRSPNTPTSAESLLFDGIYGIVVERHNCHKISKISGWEIFGNFYKKSEFLNFDPKYLNKHTEKFSRFLAKSTGLRVEKKNIAENRK